MKIKSVCLSILITLALVPASAMAYNCQAQLEKKKHCGGFDSQNKCQGYDYEYQECESYGIGAAPSP